MNEFASIALSTTSGWPAHNKHNTVRRPSSPFASSIELGAERPSKRARSENIPSPEWFRGHSNTALRPATSYGNLTDNSTHDAELLLNFSQNARSAPLSHVNHARSDSDGTQYPQGELNRRQNWSHDRRELNGSPRSSHPENDARSFRQDTTVPQGSSRRNGGVSMPNSKTFLTSSTGLRTSELLSSDFQTQLIEASRSMQEYVYPGNGNATSSNGLICRIHDDPQGVDNGSCAVDDQGNRRAEGMPLDTQGAPNHEALMPTQQSSTEAEKRDPSCVEPGYQSTRESQMLGKTYRPSMLGTTLECLTFTSESQVGPAPKGPESTIQQTKMESVGQSIKDYGSDKALSTPEPAVCASCRFTRDSINAGNDPESTSWISCDGCKSWFHFACAGFKNEREVRVVDKYRCRKCKPIHGSTTYVRKSARAHSAIDYAGLNQGVIKTSDERPEHHYIKPIKDGTINLQPDTFARMRPELVTAEYFEKGYGMKEPIVIPAEWNPQPKSAGSFQQILATTSLTDKDAAVPEDWFARDPESRNVLDHGQDALDMVIPHDLTVRRVAELYGLEEKIEVIDVKSQNGEGKKWNMKRWADYYENTSNKVVKNVISLEVSQSTLGRLIRRPQVVRDLDLQDSVWPAELQAKGEFPRVQFYCLMSVADCFTDFHIDFGGSSVFYHILKGKKTFFFIPPKEKHLKKYEEWCMSPAQNWTFLADQTKECYRVDLCEGDTMLIPSGWIHAVWTPEDSLVIGGNFLTRLNYNMQLRIAQVEKATGVARKFRYPQFQKIQWFTAIRYLESDPLPGGVRAVLEAGGSFHRRYPAYHDFDTWGENSRNGPENYHARYYSQPELEGLPDLTRYLLRTALIDSGEITEGITVETRNAIRKSIPRGFGDPQEIVKTFAVWCAWKRGNETIPHWAHSTSIPVLESGLLDNAAKLNTGSLRNSDSEVIPQVPRRHSLRNQVQPPTVSLEDTQIGCKLNYPEGNQQSEASGYFHALDLECASTEIQSGVQTPSTTSKSHGEPKTAGKRGSKRAKTGPGLGMMSHRKTACELCRRRRRACKHKADHRPQILSAYGFTPKDEASQVTGAASVTATEQTWSETDTGQHNLYEPSPNDVIDGPELARGVPPELHTADDVNPLQLLHRAAPDDFPEPSSAHEFVRSMEWDTAPSQADYSPVFLETPKSVDQKSLVAQHSRSRTIACSDCRKSKRRCLHDGNSREDPMKANDAANPRLTPPSKRRRVEAGVQSSPLSKDSYQNSLTKDASTPAQLPVSNALPLQQLDVQKPASPRLMAPNITVADSDLINQPNHIVAASGQQQHLLQPDDATEKVEIQTSQDLIQFEAEDVTSSSASEQAPTRAQIQSDMSQEVPIQGSATRYSPFSNAAHPQDLKYKMPGQMESGSSFEQPAASSLVSPPASSHDDTEQPASAVEGRSTYSGPSSRHSSRHPGQTHDFTPESVPMRRDSSSSATETSLVEKTSLPSASSPISGQGHGSAQKRMKARLHSETVADEESLRLIKELQAQDYGLRRRSRLA
ncbi:MAG: hypothetical protein Q9220_004604 [cf. Caloplaca sp. 1 TL-2023]